MFTNNNFVPDCQNIVDAALNRQPKRLPLYDHVINHPILEKVLGEILPWPDNESNSRTYFKGFSKFFHMLGYDVAAYEGALSPALPGGGALGTQKEGAIKTMEDFKKYPWDDVPEIYFKMYDSAFSALDASMPEGMRAIGGVGYGVFEVVQDLVGYTELCYMKYDDPELYSNMFQKVGDLLVAIWTELLKKHGDTFCVCRFGDDLGFRTTTLLPAEDVKELIIPQYKRIIDVIHNAGKPFLLHSCGQIFDIFDDIIDIAGIDAKHSNEDAIAPFSEWVNRYGTRIGNFGGVDTDVICHDNLDYIREYTSNVLKECEGKGGIAIGSGNSVPDYINLDAYFAMNETVRKYRGE